MCLKLLGSLGDKMVSRIDGGRVGHREGNNRVRKWRVGMVSILCSTNEGMVNLKYCESEY